MGSDDGDQRRVTTFVERLSRRLSTTGKDTPRYVCRGCERTFERRRHVCPDCGSFLIERRDWTVE